MNPKLSSDAYRRLRDAGDLPSPAQLVCDILAAVGNEDTGAHEISTLIERDPAITARLLRTVNSPVAGVSANVTSVQQATTLLGLNVIRCSVLAVSVLAEHRQGPSQKFDYEAFWSTSLARAVAMRHIASRLRAMPPDEAFTYGLLGTIGRLALVSSLPEEYSEVVDSLATSNLSELIEAEIAVFEITSEQLSAMLLADWGMPHLRAALEASHEDGGCPQYPLLGQMMKLATGISELLVDHNATRQQLATMTLLARDLGLELQQLHEMFDQMVVAWTDMGEDLSVPTRSVAGLHEIYTAAARLDVSAGKPA